MSSKHEHGHDHSHHCGCCASMDRRDFMTTVGLSALAAPGLFSLTSAAWAASPPADAKPRVRAVFCGRRPTAATGWAGRA